MEKIFHKPCSDRRVFVFKFQSAACSPCKKKKKENYIKQTSVKKTEIFNHFENWLAAFAGNRNNTKGIKEKKKSNIM